MRNKTHRLTDEVCIPPLAFVRVIGAGGDGGGGGGESEMYVLGKSFRLWCDGSSDRSFMVDPLSYFSVQPVRPTGVTKAVVCTIMSLEWYNKRTLTVNGKE